MSSLFLAFMLSQVNKLQEISIVDSIFSLYSVPFIDILLWQVWTLYLEQNASSPGTDQYNSTCALLIDFWAKVTHSILTLIKHSKVVSLDAVHSIVFFCQINSVVCAHFVSFNTLKRR